eukprot:g3996.t1
MEVLLGSGLSHGAAFALVLVTSLYAWQLCLMILLAWLVVTMGIAANLERSKLRQVHWLLAALEIFAAVLFRSGDEVKIAFFSASEVSVSELSLVEGRSFTSFRQQVVFVAKDACGQEQLWSVSNVSNVSSTAVLHQTLDPRLRLEALAVENDTLYLKASMPCQVGEPTWQSASDLDLSGQCLVSRGTLVAELFLAVLPTVLLSAGLCCRSPSLFTTLFLGIYSMVVVIRLLIDANSSALHEFIFTSLLIYSTLAYGLLITWHLLQPRSCEDWEDLKTWAFAVVPLSFSFSLQLRLGLPEDLHLWRWIVFASLGFLQLLLAQLTGRRWPRLLGLIQLLLSLHQLLGATVRPHLGEGVLRALQWALLGLFGGFLVVLGEADPPGHAPVAARSARSATPEEESKVHPEIVKTKEVDPPEVEDPPPGAPEAAMEAFAQLAAQALGQHAGLPEHQRQAYEKTQQLRQKLEAQPADRVAGPNVADVMALEEDSDAVESMEEV